MNQMPMQQMVVLDQFGNPQVVMMAPYQVQNQNAQF